MIRCEEFLFSEELFSLEKSKENAFLCVISILYSCVPTHRVVDQMIPLFLHFHLLENLSLDYAIPILTFNLFNFLDVKGNLFSNYLDWSRRLRFHAV